MKNKSFLPLLELILMIGIFTLAAAICLNTFATANKLSKQSEAKFAAVNAAESVAEAIKSSNGDFSAISEKLGGIADSDSLTVYYDSLWVSTDSENAEFILQVTKKNSGTLFLGTALITVYHGDDLIYELTVGWQEVSENGK